jgi:hypothetical protein
MADLSVELTECVVFPQMVAEAGDLGSCVGGGVAERVGSFDRVGDVGDVQMSLNLGN